MKIYNCTNTGRVTCSCMAKATFHLKAPSRVAVRMRRAQRQHGGGAAVRFLRQYYASRHICFKFLAKEKENKETKAQCLATGTFGGIITMKVINVSLSVCVLLAQVN